MGQVLDFIQPVAIFPEFVAGIFYAPFLTAPLSVAAIFVLGRLGNPLMVALVAGLGAMVSDLLILKFFRFMIFGKSSPLHENESVKSFIHVLKVSPVFRHFAPAVGAFIIASPLPDEIGLAILGLTNLKFGQLALITFSLNALGIFLIALVAKGLS